MRGWRPGRGEVLAVALGLYGGLVGAVLCLIVWSGLIATQRTAVADSVRAEAGVLAVVAVLGLAGFVALAATVVGRYTRTARRLAAETRVLLHANPDLRLDRSGPPELAALAAAVDELAELRRVAEREVATQVETAGASLEQERNRLATLMAELAVAVIVCTADGRILLYNSAARSLVADVDAVGLGRTVFGVVDRDLLTYAADRFAAGSTQAQVATTVRGQQVLQVHLGVVRGTSGGLTGFVLVLEDLTERLRRSDHRDALLRELTQGTRAALGSLQAAIETVVDYPDMEPAERGQFLAIVRDEARGMGRAVERWVVESVDDLGAGWLLTAMSGQDLVSHVGRSVRRAGSVSVTEETAARRSTTGAPTTESIWVRADSHALAQAVVHLAGHLRQECGVETAALTIAVQDRYAHLEMTWARRAPAPEVFQSWLDEPLPGGAAGGTVREVVERHGGEIWCAEAAAGSAYLRLLLPLAATTPDLATAVDVGAAQPGGASRPEFYDFDLFDWAEGTAQWLDRPLAEVGYTVFDTETTGLDPHGADGDEIVSIGAVRVVNGRLLRTETFEQLVDPQRSVPPSSTVFHGITADMLAGRPTIDTVLPSFARFAQDTVLVGHNVSFDLQFLRLKEARTGVRLRQPVLDTLLLDAALHPDHDEHSLEAIAARLGVEVVGRHTAAGDALVTGEIFVRLLALLRQRGIATVGAAVELSRTTLQARADRNLYGPPTAEH